MSNPKYYIVNPSDNDIYFKAPYVIFSGYLKDEPNWFSNNHSHDCLEIILCTKGSGVTEIDNKPYEISEGDLVIYQPFVMHKEHSNPIDALAFFFLGVNDFIFPPFPPNTILGEDDTPVHNLKEHIDIRMQLELFFSELIRETTYQEPYYKAITASVASCMMALIMRLYRLHKDNGESDMIRHSIRVKEYIDRNYTSNINLNSISQSAYISKHYISHVFKSDFGMSPIEYLINKRISMSKQLLCETKLPVADIALRVGYEDSVYFSQIFKKIVGVPPTKYRENQLKS